jgi:hypothetical protein
MNRKLIGSIAIFGLSVVLAGCSGLASTGAVDEAAAPVEQAVIERGKNSAAAGEKEAGETENIIEEETADMEIKGNVDDATGPVVETAAQRKEGDSSSRITAQLELPPPDHELADGEYRWNQLLGRDSIYPVYEPEFAPAESAPYDDNELVIGVEINGEAKAYAIGPLNSREMVNDTVGDVPVLVTW